MNKPIELSDISLPVTEDPFLQRSYVLRSSTIHMRANNLSGRVGMIAQKAGKSLEKMARLNEWEPNLFVLALEHLCERFCCNIYDQALELESEREDGDESVGAVVGSDGSGGGDVGGDGGTRDQVLGSPDDAGGADRGSNPGEVYGQSRILNGHKFDGDDGDLRK